MKVSIGSTGLGLSLLILAVGCAGPLKQITHQASELSRSPAFTRESLVSSKVGILTATGVENYRLVIGDPLAMALKETEPNIQLSNMDETLTLINQAHLSREYTEMLRDYKVSGILQKEMLNRIHQVVNARYLILPTLLEYRRDTSTRISILGIRFVETRSSTLRVFAQIWNAETGDIVWEGSSQATVAGEDIREKPIPFEEVALLAWSELFKKLP
jgi:hypothetical protein